MIVQATQPLFPWDELQASPTLGTIRVALEAIPDAPLLAALQARRHNDCDTYPVRVLWGVLLLSILLRHATTEACLEELRRNALLRLLVGIESEVGSVGVDLIEVRYEILLKKDLGIESPAAGQRTTSV